MTIDGRDILSTWGVTLLEDSYSGLFKYPTRTNVSYTNYAERDGITPDLRKIEFQSKSVPLKFLMEHKTEDDFWKKYQTFYSDMTSVGYRVMNLENGLIHKLRYDKTASYDSPNLFNWSNTVTSFTLNFIEDKNSIPATAEPIGGVSLRGVYGINGRDFGEFGIHPDGEIGSMLHYPDVKEPFTDGQTYDLNTRRLKHKEITLPLWILANSKSEFINNYSAFFNQFNRTGKQSLYIKEIGGTTYAYYTECPSYTVHWNNNGQIGAKFSIKIVVPVVTWLNGTTTILTVVKDPILGLLADDQGRIITFNR